MHRGVWVRSWATFVLLWTAGSGGLLGAQARSTGALSGAVLDETGAKIPGVGVTAVSPADIRPEVTATDDEGRYRFENLTPGLYTVRAELSGFATVVRQEIRVDVGKDYPLDLTLKLVTITETVTVVGEAPVIDPESSTIRTNYQYEFLQNIPQPRAGTGSAILKIAPGMDTSLSVGGSAEAGATAWHLDGVDVSDPKTGTQFPFYNYDYIEEGEIITFGAPAEYGKFAGAVFNVVTKSGGSEYHGTANLYYTGSSLVSDNIEDINRQYAGNSQFVPLEADDIIRRYDGTVNVGGPIKKNVLHFFGAFQQVVDDTRPAGQTVNRTDRSTRVLGKLTWQASPRHRISGFYEFDSTTLDGLQQTKGTLDPNAAFAQPSPNSTPWVNWQFTPSDKSILEVQYSGFYGYFDREPQNDLPGIRDFGSSREYQNARERAHNGRSRTEVRADYSRFVDRFAGRHQFKFGAGYELGTLDETRQYGTNSLGQNVLYYATFGEIYGGITRLGSYSNKTENRVVSFYAHDSWTIADRLTLNLGVRYDRGVGRFTNPDVDAFTFDDVAPRLFATLDVTGDGKTIIRGGFGRYYEALFADSYHALDPSLPVSNVFFFRAGSGGCGMPVAGFPTVGAGRECFSGVNAPNARIVAVLNPLLTTGIDPSLANHYLDEAALGFERELFADFSFAATYIHKADGNLFGGRDTLAQFGPTTVTDPLTGATIPAYQRLTPATQSLILLTNRDDLFDRRYDGVELRFQKRYRDNWQLLGSWTIQKAQGSHNNNTDTSAADAVQGVTYRGANPNDLINADGELLNSRTHVFKVQGSYRIPRADVLLGWLFSGQSGRTYSPVIRARLPNRVGIYSEPRGERRLDTLTTLDLRLEKRFRLGSKGSELGILVDVFNVANSAAVEEVNVTAGPAFELPLAVSPPRVLQFGVRWQF